MKKVMKKVIAAMVSTAMLLPPQQLPLPPLQQVIPRHQKVGVQWARTEWTTHRGSHLKSVLPPMHQQGMLPETESARLERE